MLSIETIQLATGIIDPLWKDSYVAAYENVAHLNSFAFCDLINESIASINV